MRRLVSGLRRHLMPASPLATIKKGSLKEPPGPKPAARMGRAW